MFFNCIMGNEGFSICMVWLIKGTLTLTIPFIVSVSMLNWECVTELRVYHIQKNYSASCCISIKDKTVKKTPCWSKLMFLKSESNPPLFLLHPPSFFPPFSTYWNCTSHAISMNMKSVQIKWKGKDTVLGPLIQLDAAQFGALCWWIMDESEN